MHSLVHNKLSKMQMQRGGANQDYMLPNVPNDGVSNIAFGVMNNTTLLASSSWCGQVGVWLVYNNGSAESGGFISHDGPALGCDVDSQNGVVYSAGADGKVKAWDVVAKQDVVVGEHKGPVRSVKYLPDMSCLVSGGWDKSYKVWDIRAGSMVMDANLPDDVFAMDLQDQVGVFAIGPKGIAVYDMRNAQNPLKSFDSPHEVRTMLPFLFFPLLVPLNRPPPSFFTLTRPYLLPLFLISLHAFLSLTLNCYLSLFIYCSCKQSPWQ